MPATIKHPHGHEFPAPPANPPPPPGAVTLFERLGEKPGITRLVKWFYARVRFDPLLEPIFNAHIPKWGEHLDLLIDYWCGAVGGPTTYPGGMGKHFRLGLGREHFSAWLRVWEDNCHDLLQPREASEMIALARNIADDVQRMIARRDTQPSERNEPTVRGERH